jgi:hypothetical protein
VSAQAPAPVVAEPEPDWLSLEEYRALPREERRRRYLAAWNPWRWHSPRGRRSWEILLEQLGDGHWHLAADVCRQMLEDSLLSWKACWQTIDNATHAGVLEAHRIEGSKFLRKRFIRLRSDAPRHLLCPPSP